MILASKECLFSSKCLYIDGIIFKSSFISALFIVLIKKRRSWEKKKKLPDLPAPSPALKTMFLLCFGAKLAWILPPFSKKSGKVALNRCSRWNVTFTSRLITYSSATSDELLADLCKVDYIPRFPSESTLMGLLLTPPLLSTSPLYGRDEFLRDSCEDCISVSSERKESLTDASFIEFLLSVMPHCP